MRNKSDWPLFLSLMCSTVADWSPCPRFARTVLIDGPGPGQEPNRRPVRSERRPLVLESQVRLLGPEPGSPGPVFGIRSDHQSSGKGLSSGFGLSGRTGLWSSFITVRR